MPSPLKSGPVAVVGGGLAGLTAAIELAQGGLPVTLYEQSSHLGGRAVTKTMDGFSFNLGPRALYLGGAARQMLEELAVPYTAHRPPLQGALALVGDRIQPLPLGLGGLMKARWLSPGEKWEIGRLMARLPRVDADAWHGQPTAHWLERQCSRPGSHKLVTALLRLVAYASDPGAVDAAAMIRQLQIGISPGVVYVDGGWQTLVDGLRHVAIDAGVRLETRHRVTGVMHQDSVEGLELADADPVCADAVVLAIGPDTASRLAQGSRRLAGWARAARPVHAACLDVALERLPQPQHNFALGMDSPFYYSVHSASARLAPDGGALVHVLESLPTEEAGDRRQVEARLEGVLNRLQSGWRDVVARRRLLPHMLVCHGLPMAGSDEVMPVVDDVDGLYIAGDWVGRNGLLADASVASARAAASAILNGTDFVRPPGVRQGSPRAGEVDGAF